ncbi:hypothetical protein GCM10009718_33330 [Isoptericola halotolerans]|uniref:Uncharacterized protein n=1 Tax=Isoptericola halotolerans TaxID=300560 RepID=A0ABX2A948_9MICO|nr:hypothetical protein [Isoptericola halotolerans]NOV98221.1 hypothetical protein [Isoptericola halotolerans]
MTEEAPEGAKKGGNGCLLWGCAVPAGLVLLLIASCTISSFSGGESAGSQCRSLASSTYGGDNRFTEVTFTDGDFIKGTIGQIVGGEERPYAHWECSMESGEPEITFYSPAN